MFDFSKKGGMYVPVDESQTQDVSGADVEVIVRDRRRGCRFACITIVFSFFAGVLLSTLLMVLIRSQVLSNKDLGRLKPYIELPTETVLFNQNKLFQDLPSKTTDKVWDDLLAPSKGFFMLDHSERYNISQGISHGPHKHVYGASMFHQIHCLAMIRSVYYGILTQKHDLNDYIIDHQPEPKPNPNSNPFASRIHNSNITNNRQSALTSLVDHTKQCFDYILQGIKCAGDMTAEPTEQGGKINGWGVAHQCKSFDVAVEFMRSHKVNL